jgi:hypothetical protein
MFSLSSSKKSSQSKIPVLKNIQNSFNCHQEEIIIHIFMLRGSLFVIFIDFKNSDLFV